MSFAQYTDIHNFCCNEGGPPQPPGILAQGRDGKLYGSNGSRLFRIGPIGVQPLYAEFHTFNFGNLPERGGLTLGTDGYFYGTQYLGAPSISEPSLKLLLPVPSRFYITSLAVRMVPIPSHRRFKALTGASTARLPVDRLHALTKSRPLEHSHRWVHCRDFQSPL